MAIIDPAKLCLFAEMRKVFRRNKDIMPEFPNLGGNAWPELKEGIYQMMPINGKRVCIRRDFYEYVITHTPAQQARREKFAAAVAGWQSLTDEEKSVYNKKASGKPMSGYNWFLRNFMLGM